MSEMPNGRITKKIPNLMALRIIWAFVVTIGDPITITIRATVSGHTTAFRCADLELMIE